MELYQAYPIAFHIDILGSLDYKNVKRKHHMLDKRISNHTSDSQSLTYSKTCSIQIILSNTLTYLSKWSQAQHSLISLIYLGTSMPKHKHISDYAQSYGISMISNDSKRPQCQHIHLYTHILIVLCTCPLIIKHIFNITFIFKYNRLFKCSHNAQEPCSYRPHIVCKMLQQPRQVYTS